MAFTYVAPKFDSPVPASLAGWAFTGLGAFLMSLFTYIRYRFCVVADSSLGLCHRHILHYELGVV